ncbi:MAG: glucosaminidase domain-containing protein [Saprospiraceae bacterium]|nr:glucosaminidase domain-containing protein [Saprospiraceae bacterium]
MKCKSNFICLLASFLVILLSIVTVDVSFAQTPKGGLKTIEALNRDDVQAVSARIAYMYDADAAIVEQYVQAAVDIEGRSGVAAPIVIAIAIHESSFKSDLFLNSGNPFGIKASRPWTGPSYTKWHDGEETKFRKYSSAAEAVWDFSNFVKSRSWYADVFNCPMDDSRCVIDGLKKTDFEPGYSMNSNWDEAVMAIIQKVGLQALVTR